MEGYSPSVYNDAVNVKTLGYGLTGKEIEGLNNISEETATKLLTKYINDNYFSKVLSIIKSKGVEKPLQREIDAFASFAYNLGVNAFESV
jgi:GH24 family phage-related lysozyme (muramidase)